MLSYAGIPLPLCNAQAQAWVDRSLPLETVHAPLWRERARNPRLGSLLWPVGASRWAECWLVCDGARLEQIRRAVYANNRYQSAELVMGAAPQQVRADLWMLQPRPLSGATGGPEGFWLLPLVDSRYWWWIRTTGVFAVGDSETWAEILARIAGLAGAELDSDPIPAVYGLPPYLLSRSEASIPPLLDEACGSVASRLVCGLDGFLRAQRPQEALESFLRQHKGLHPIMAGGRIRGGWPVREDSLARLPELVAVSFSRTDGRVPDPASRWTEEVYLRDLPEIRAQALGAAGFRHDLPTSAVAAFGSAEEASPDNREEIRALARQIALDWYRWRLADHDFKLAGIRAWEPDGLSEIEWHVSAEACYTRVTAPVALGGQGGSRGTADAVISSGTGGCDPCGSRTLSLTSSGGAISPDPDTSFGLTGTSSWTDLDLYWQTVRVQVTQDSSFSISSGRTLSIEGSGTFLLKSPVAIPPFSFSISNGTNNNVSLTSVTRPMLRLTGPSGAWSITGFARSPLPDGLSFTIVNTTGYPGIIKHQDSGSDASFRIDNPGGADIEIPDDASFSITYDPTDLRWKLAGASPSVSALTTKGDLYVRGASAPARLAAGTNGYVLSADSAEATGLKWIPASSGSSGTWTKYTRTYADFSTGSTTNTLTLLSLADTDVIEAVVIWVKTAFSGGAIATYDLDLKRSSTTMTGTVDGTTAGSCEQTFPKGRGFVDGLGLDGNASPPGTSDFQVRAVCTGANLSAATAGSVDIWIKVASLP